MSFLVLAFPDRLTGRLFVLVLVADSKLQSPAQLRAQIMRPIELMKAAVWFFARQMPGIKIHQKEPPPPHQPHADGVFPVCASARHVRLRGDRVPSTGHRACWYVRVLQDDRALG